MGKVLTHLTMSLDGYIADPNDQVGDLFEWYQAGDVAMSTANEDVSFQVDPESAAMLRDLIGDAGALLSGRRLFDLTDGWGDEHPIGAPVVVVTHHVPDDAAEKWPRTTFIDGVAAAIDEAKSIAGERNVIISSATIAQQALALGLVDEVGVSLAPVLLGDGIPYFAKGIHDYLFLDDPTIVQGRRAVHLFFPVRR